MATSDVIVLPDAHVPHQEAKAWAASLRIIRDVQPNRIVIIGDFADLESLSHHPRNRPEITKLRRELDAVNSALDSVLKASQYSKVVYIEGNHEYRAVKHVLSSAPHLDGMLDISKALHLSARGVLWVPLRKHTRRPWISPWGVGYMHSAKSNSRYSSGANHSAYHANVVGPFSSCRNIVYGHHHTLQSYHSHAGFTATCCGFLGDFDADDPTFDYESGPTTWQHGLVYQQISGQAVSTTMVPIVKGRYAL